MYIIQYNIAWSLSSKFRRTHISTFLSYKFMCHSADFPTLSGNLLPLKCIYETMPLCWFFSTLKF